MASILLWLLLAYFVCEAYRIGATPRQKRIWEGFFKTHHGEVGIVLAALGAIARSPALVAAGIGLMLHDRKDAGKWFSGDKQESYSQ